MKRPSVLTAPLLQAIRGQYRLEWDGIHGISHWARVRTIGLRLTAQTGADPDVVDLFSVLQDAGRVNDDRDPHHGRRGAALAATLRGQGVDLPDAAFALLVTACADHTTGSTEAPVTVQICWDADRLDLGRVGIAPDPVRLCTAAARVPRLVTWATRLHVVFEALDLAQLTREHPSGSLGHSRLRPEAIPPAFHAGAIRLDILLTRRRLIPPFRLHDQQHEGVAPSAMPPLWSASR